MRDPTFNRFDTVHTHTRTHTHDDGYFPRIASAARVKSTEVFFTDLSSLATFKRSILVTNFSAFLKRFKLLIIICTNYVYTVHYIVCLSVVLSFT